MSENETDKLNDPRWRDPLSIGWQAHRRLMLLKLRWHQASTRRGTVRVEQARDDRLAGRVLAHRRRTQEAERSQ